MKRLTTIILGLTVFVSAIQVVRMQHESRKLFVEIQELEKKRDQLSEEWGRLQLEQSTWATNDRIEELARTRLSMQNPDLKSLVLLMQ